MILIEARRLVVEMSINDLAGTTSWSERFMRRNGLCMRTKTTMAQKLPREYERKIIEFHKYVINMRKKLCFEIGQFSGFL
jgi:oligoribonuclease (3'-5' exoribonuclease)